MEVIFRFYFGGHFPLKILPKNIWRSFSGFAFEQNSSPISLDCLEVTIEKTPLGKPALGLKTRKRNKPSNRFVLRKRRRVSKRSRGGRDS